MLPSQEDAGPAGSSSVDDPAEDDTDTSLGRGMNADNINAATDTAFEHARLCEILYDIYGGKTPEGGINTKAVRAAGLTVSG